MTKSSQFHLDTQGWFNWLLNLRLSMTMYSTIASLCSFDYEDYGYQTAPLVKVMMYMLYHYIIVCFMLH